MPDPADRPDSHPLSAQRRGVGSRRPRPFAPAQRRRDTERRHRQAAEAVLAGLRAAAAADDGSSEERYEHAIRHRPQTVDPSAGDVLSVEVWFDEDPEGGPVSVSYLPFGEFADRFDDEFADLLDADGFVDASDFSQPMLCVYVDLRPLHQPAGS